MSYQTLDVEIVDKIGRVHMKRPEKGNSMVATGAGRHFCSGMDLAVFGESAELADSAQPAGGEARRHPSRRGERFRSTALKLQDTFTALERARFPVLCAIQGACIGGGIDMVSAADMRYATADAFFSIQEINIAMTADCR